MRFLFFLFDFFSIEKSAENRGGKIAACRDFDFLFSVFLCADIPSKKAPPRAPGLGSDIFRDRDSRNARGFALTPTPGPPVWVRTFLGIETREMREGSR